MLSNQEISLSVVRPFLVYGPRQKTNRFLPYVIDACLRDKTFELSHCEQVRDFCFVKDLVNAIFDFTVTKSGRPDLQCGNRSYSTKKCSRMDSKTYRQGNAIFGAIPRDYKRT